MSKSGLNNGTLEGQFSAKNSTICSCTLSDITQKRILLNFSERDATRCGIQVLMLRRGESIDVRVRVDGKGVRLETELVRVVSAGKLELAVVTASRSWWSAIEGFASSDKASGSAAPVPNVKTSNKPAAPPVGQSDRVESSTSHVERYGSSQASPSQPESAPALSGASSSTASSAHVFTGAQRSQIIDELYDVAEEFFEQQFPNFIRKAGAEIERAIAVESNGRRKDELRASVVSLTTRQRQFLSALLSGLQSNFGYAVNNKPLADDLERAANSGNLDGVAQDSFADWLQIKVLISNAENVCRKQLLELQVRLDCFAELQDEHHANPLRPGVLCVLMQQSVRQIRLGDTSEKIIYRVFSETILENLPSFYQDVNEFLDRKGLRDDRSLASYTGPRSGVRESRTYIPAPASIPEPPVPSFLKEDNDEGKALNNSVPKNSAPRAAPIRRENDKVAKEPEDVPDEFHATALDLHDDAEEMVSVESEPVNNDGASTDDSSAKRKNSDEQSYHEGLDTAEVEEADERSADASIDVEDTPDWLMDGAVDYSDEDTFLADEFSSNDVVEREPEVEISDPKPSQQQETSENETFEPIDVAHLPVDTQSHNPRERFDQAPNSGAGHTPRSPVQRNMSSAIVESERVLASRAPALANHFLSSSVESIKKKLHAGPKQHRSEFYSRRELDQAFLVYQKQQKRMKASDPIPSLLDHISKMLAQLGGKTKKIPDNELSIMVMIDRLFEDMLGPLNIAPALKPYLVMFKVVFARANIRDPHLWEDSEHPIRAVLNSIAQLGIRGGALKKEVLKVVEELVNYLLKHYDTDLVVFMKVLPQLEKLIAAQEDFYRRNLARVRETYQGQERINLAKQKVEKEIRRIFQPDNGGQAEVAGILKEMMDAGWRELLVLSYLRQGEESAPWKMGLGVLEQTNNIILGRSGSQQGALFSEKDLLQVITKGFAKATSNQQKYTTVLEKLRRYLAGTVPSSQISVISLEELFVDEEVSAFQGLRVGSRSRKSEVRRKWRERVNGLQIGDWLSFDSDNFKETRAQLGWMSEAKDCFVFVNQQGVKILEKKAYELALELQEGRAHIVSSIEIAAVDSGLENMVRGLYSEVTYDAIHDALTGLMGRKEFKRHVEQLIIEAKRDNEAHHCLCYLDLDDFKLINNNCGQDGGDKVLSEIADILRSGVLKGDIVGRLGGNEFGIVFHGRTQEQGLRLATRLHAMIQKYRFEWNHTPYSIGISVGLMQIDENAGSLNQLFQCVEGACATAKESGGNRIQVYKPDHDELKRRKEAMAWIDILNRAMEDDRLVLRLQPIVEIAPSEEQLQKNKKRNFGYPFHSEVLLGVLNERGEMMPPLEFIRAAERFKRMQVLDRWVLNTIFDWALKNPKTIRSLGGVSINLSGHSVNDEEMLRYICAELKRTKLDPRLFCFEVTETVAVNSINDAADFITEMKRMGCGFSLDDFGTGLSSYFYLKHLPVDNIKIDGAFIKNIAGDRDDFALVKSMTEMGHLMGKRVIAEYVSSPEIVKLLRTIGVDFVQGYLVGCPVVIDELCDGKPIRFPVRMENHSNSGGAARSAG